MTSTTTTVGTAPAPAPAPGPGSGSAPARPAGPRLWALSGLAAGLLGGVAIEASMRVDAVYDERYAGDPERILDRLAECVPAILTFHTAMMAATVLLLVFGAGLRRRLAAQTPAGSILPDVAAAGTWLTAVAGLIGTGFTTEMVFGVSGDDSALTPDMAVVFAHWVGTIPWLWVGAGVTGVALAVAALRHRAAPRWIGWVGAVVGGLTLVAGLSPMQYMAGFLGPVVILVAGAGFVLGDRESRRLS